MGSNVRGLEHIAARPSARTAIQTLLSGLLLATLVASAGCKRFQRKHIPVEHASARSGAPWRGAGLGGLGSPSRRDRLVASQVETSASSPREAASER